MVKCIADARKDYGPCNMGIDQFYMSIVHCNRKADRVD